MFGEIALLDPNKATRALSAMSKTDCIFLLLNFEAFDLLIKEKLKREREMMGKFVHSSIPFLSENFTLYNVVSNVHILFKKTVIILNLLSLLIP
jgi:CRP-like cAMP-binding protein